MPRSRSSDSATSSPPDDSASLGQQAYQVLRRALRDGLIQPNRYYSESEFADMLGISRTPVREALKALEREGVLEAARHRGYRLRSFSEAEIEEIIALRRALERIAVKALIAKGEDADLERLADVLRRQDEDVEGKEIFALDEEFHLLIADLAGLTRTHDLLLGLRSAAAAVSGGASVPLEQTRLRVGEHHAIYDAIVAGDTAKAGRLMDRHVEAAVRELVKAAASEQVIEPLGPSRAGTRR
ncbi:MAG: GntR family transcriptional regulator [Actinobacteria bacterium]|nr:GntR family transcriptional regulator [Actinomycetota bacterium]